LPAIINLHDVLLAQTFTDRVIGLRAGEIVYDGEPNSLSTGALSQIYGEEDWTALQRGRDADDRSTDSLVIAEPALHRRASVA
jgi:phosphonate transport system ATP-binding protein